MVQDEDDAYESLREACDRGEGCPRCLTTVPWLIRKVARSPKPFHCEACSFDFHGWADAFATPAAA